MAVNTDQVSPAAASPPLSHASGIQRTQEKKEKRKKIEKRKKRKEADETKRHIFAPLVPIFRAPSFSRCYRCRSLVAKFARRNEPACSRFATAGAWDRMAVMDAA